MGEEPNVFTEKLRQRLKRDFPEAAACIEKGW